MHYFEQLTNQAIIWDDIIHTKEDAAIHLKNQRPKYLFTDITDKFGCVCIKYRAMVLFHSS